PRSAYLQGRGARRPLRRDRRRLRLTGRTRSVSDGVGPSRRRGGATPMRPGRRPPITPSLTLRVRRKTTMPDLLATILHGVTARSYVPLKPKPLFKRLNLGDEQYPEFRRTVRELIRTGRLATGRNNTLRAADAHGTLTGVYRRVASGHGFVRPHVVDGTFKP